MPDPYWENVGKQIEQKRAERARDRGQQFTGEPGRLKPIGRQGERKCRCASCGFAQYEHWTARTKRGRIRCPQCGSIAYEPYTKDARHEIADMNDVRKSYDAGQGDGKFSVGR
jgi:hypothetical protein